MSSSYTHSEEIHPLETFRPSMDYAHFETDIINPYVRTARIYANLLANSGPLLTFALGRPSFTKLRNFLIDTDYDHSSRLIGTLPYNTEPKTSANIPFDHSFQLVGYFSPKHPDCFVWEDGTFEKGSTVYFGKS